MTNKIPHFSGKVSIKIILKNSRNGKVLIVREPQDKDWQLPGGRTEESEKFYQTIARELLEELHLKLSQFKINFVYNEQVLHIRDQAMQMTVFFEIKLEVKDIKKIKVSDEVAELCWVDKKTYKKYTYFSDIGNALKCYYK